MEARAWISRGNTRDKNILILMKPKVSHGNHRICDGKCYNAKGKICRCICGGINHGVGRDQALENTRRLGMDHPEIEREVIISQAALQANWIEQTSVSESLQP